MCGMTVITHDTVPFLVARVATLMNAWHADFRSLGLSVLTVRVMAVLSLNGGTTVGDLAEATSIDQSTLSHILRRLERRKLIKKSRQDPDNRSVKVTTTGKGRALARKCHETAMKHDRDLIRGLPVAQVRALKKTLHKLYANVKR
jgi:MarR family transcriptional regulator, organic hydroperoxide resistance regulator